ncbi:NADH-quinone oxidoreductase subunit J family protein [Thalassoglobus polymorphus]|uniref:NADH-quinone oxidoreductase subunit J n=1 Tax=Thalassoglobus polymorphus TaxID=2527994 RepID=A0A517QTU8_9PLAN|nr:NADH-quinone oxidoreductase subunit J [Thalassoglobus polymorphus]QDT34967.1 NADH-quinone oxidoreductase subunit J [Thalassoglobus polymorphus]
MAEYMFYLYAAIACGGAIAVVLSQNVVRMAFWLVISLSSVAFLFFLLGADFVGATQLLIYVGGTVVLLIFGVMLTSSGPYKTIQSNPAELVQSGMIGLAFLALISSTVFSVDWSGNTAKLTEIDAQLRESREHQHSHDHGHDHEHGHTHHGEEVRYGYNPETQGNTTRSIGTALLGVRFDKDLRAGNHAHGETTLSTGYLLPFEIISVHLLVVLVGAAYLARAKRRVDAQDA